MRIGNKVKGRGRSGWARKSSCGVKLYFSHSWFSMLCTTVLTLCCYSCIVVVSGENFHDEVQVAVTPDLAKVTTSTVTTAGDSVTYNHVLKSPEQIITRWLQTIANPPTDYILHFTIEPLGINSDHGSILLFTDDVDKNQNMYGYRTPAVFLNEDSTKLLIRTGTDAEPNGGSFSSNDLPLNMKTSVRIEVLGTIRKIFINNTEVITDSIGIRSQLSEVDVYLGNPRNYDAANARVSNMIFTSNSFSRYDLIAEPEIISTRLLTNIVHPPTDYVLQFTIEPLGTISDLGAILLFTDNNEYPNYGDRAPGVYFKEGTTRLLIVTGTNDDYDHLLTSPEQITTRKLRTIVNPPTDYILHFTIEPLGTVSDDVSSILLFTNNASPNAPYLYGDRCPAVWFETDSSRLRIVTGTNAVPTDSYSSSQDLPLDIQTSVRIEVLGTMRKVFIDNTEVHQQEIGTRSQLAEVDAYVAGSPAGREFPPANARISDVRFTSHPESLSEWSLAYQFGDSNNHDPALWETGSEYTKQNGEWDDPTFYIRRICRDCAESHYDIIYKRLTTVPSDMDIQHLFLVSWVDENNVMGVDFQLYSSFEDAENDSNEWLYCNYSDLVGFPRDCGPVSHTGHQWNSITRDGGKSDISYYVLNNNPTIGLPNNLPLNVKSTVRIEVVGTTRDIFIDNIKVLSDSIDTRSQLVEVNAHVGGVSGMNTANAMISNVLFDSIPSSTNYPTTRYGDLVSEPELIITRRHLATLVQPPTDYILQFTIKPLGTVGIESSILTFTTGNVGLSGQNQYGDRVPMVTFSPDSTRLGVTIGTDADPYYHVDVVDSLTLDTESTVRIEVVGTLLKIFVNNVEVINQIINTRSQLAEVDAYLGIIDAANATVSDVTFNSYIPPTTFPTTSPTTSPTISPTVDICKDCNDHDLFDCEFLLQQTKQDANAICGFISREKSVKQYCKNQLFKKYATCLTTSIPTSHPTTIIPNYRNVALPSNGGVASQSTTFNGGVDEDGNTIDAVASRAIDGSTNGLFNSGSIARTNGVSEAINQWWKVKLTSTYSISQVKVYARTDECCRGTIKDFIMTIYRDELEVYNSSDKNPDESSTEKSIYIYQISPSIKGDVVQIGMNFGNVEVAEVVVNVREEMIN